MKNIRFFYLNFFPFLVVKFSIYLNRHGFVMCCNFLMFVRPVFDEVVLYDIVLCHSLSPGRAVFRGCGLGMSIFTFRVDCIDPKYTCTNITL